MLKDKSFCISFVRHAESLGNIGAVYTPEFHKDDPPLSSDGLIQAELLGKSSITDGVTLIYSSSLIRAVQTAYPTAQKLSKEIILLPDLMEIGTAVSGTDLWRLERDFPLAVPCLDEPTPAGGTLLLGDEDTQKLTIRGKRCIEHICKNAVEGDHIMVVSHGSFFGYLIRAALGIDLPESFCWQVDNCCVTKVIFRKGAIPKLSFANYTGHLEKRCL